MSPSSRPVASRPEVYSVDRVKRLRIALWLTLVLGVLLSVLEGSGIGDPEVNQKLTRIALACYLLVAVFSATTLWLLGRRDLVTRVSAIVTGTVLALVGVLTVAVLVGWLSLLLGIAVLALALLPDDPGLES